MHSCSFPAAKYTIHKTEDTTHAATKLPVARCEATADFDKYLVRSLERLRTDHVDYYLVHNVTSAEAGGGARV